jgi:hypothetical protein
MMKECSDFLNIAVYLVEVNTFVYFFFRHGALAPSGPVPPHCRGFTIVLRHTTLDRTLWTIDQPVARDLYLTTHSTHKRQSSRPLSGFEPTIPVSEQPQTHALDPAATGIGVLLL